MDPFRLSLLLIGVAVIAAIYLWGRWRRRRAKRDYIFDEPLPEDDASATADGEEWEIIPLPRHAERGMPMEEAQLKELAGLNGRAAKAGLSPEEEAALLAFNAEEGESETPAPVSEELMVLTVIAQDGEAFTGPTLSDVFEQLGLVYGEMQLFHRHAAADGAPVFSIVNIIEPGYFDLTQLPELRTPGLALFMRLPGPLSGEAAFEDLLATARRLASALEGRLGDQQRHVLSNETIAQMRARARRHAAQ